MRATSARPASGLADPPWIQSTVPSVLTAYAWSTPCKAISDPSLVDRSVAPATGDADPKPLWIPAVSMVPSFFTAYDRDRSMATTATSEATLCGALCVPTIDGPDISNAQDQTLPLG